jgi:dienelactone hydrolase
MCAYRYCFGGACAVRLGSSDLVNSIVVCHPAPCTLDQVKAIKVPIANFVTLASFHLLELFRYLLHGYVQKACTVAFIL